VQPGTQRIGDIPTRSTSTVAATAQGNREFTAKGWLLRVGAVWEAVHNSGIAAQVHAGPAMLSAKGTFRINDKWVSPGQPTLTQTANGDRTKSLFGFYAGATLQARLNDQWSVFAGGDYLDVGSFKISAPSAFAKFNFSHSILATAGIGFRF
jgi:opacity protein-like surface antigen